MKHELKIRRMVLSAQNILEFINAIFVIYEEIATKYFVMDY